MAFSFSSRYRIALVIVLFCDTLVSHAKEVSLDTIACNISGFQINNAVCNGVCNGSAFVNAVGNGPITYNWQAFPGYDTSAVFGLCAGTYIVSITDSLGCTVLDSAIISEPPPIGFSISVQDATCPGGCNGSISIFPTDSGSYTFFWPGFADTTSTLSGICPGTYNYVLTDSIGCSGAGTAEVFSIQPYFLSFGNSPATCASSCDGTATVFATGAPPFTYSWNTGPAQTTQTAVGLCAGIYFVSVTDSLGCVVTDSVVVPYGVNPAISLSASPATCYNICDGQAIAFVSGTGNYFYSWNTIPAQDSSFASGLCAGIQSVIITDLNNNCSWIDSVEVTQPDPLQLNFSTTSPSCLNSCNGISEVIPSVPGNYTFLWQSGNTSSIDSLLCPGLYAVSVTDSVGCVSTDSVTITVPSLPVIITNASCTTVCDGAAIVQLFGSAPYQISWNTNPVQNSDTAIGLCEGNYNVLVIDSSGCQLSGDVTISSGNPVALSFTQTNPSCPGICDGSVSVVPSGNFPFTFIWNNDSLLTTNSLNQVCSGTYSVVVTDSIGCQQSDSVSIIDPNPVTFSFAVTPNSCAGICDGQAAISASSAGSYVYSWQTNPPQFGINAINLCQGYAVVNISTSGGCSYADSVLILGPSPMFLNISSTGVSCNGNCDGFMSANVFGGNPGYGYQWSSGFTTQQVINVCPGSYTVTVTDMLGCSKVDSVTINNPDPLQILFNVIDATCQACNDGSISATVSGGTPGYSYIWSPNGENTAAIDSLITGFYTLCVADANQCLFCDGVFVSFTNSLNDPAGDPVKILVYPNPATDNTSISIAGYRVTPQKVNIEVYDVTGKLVSGVIPTSKDISSSQTRLFLDLNSIAPGLYQIRISSEKGTLGSARLVVR